jgi:hypothetical protein
MIQHAHSSNPRYQIQKVFVEDVIDKLYPSNIQQKEDLKQVIIEHTKLFDGALGSTPQKATH